MFTDEKVRHYVYLIYAIVLAILIVFSFVTGDITQALALLALLAPMGLAVKNTSPQ